MDSDTLNTASSYLNNLLLARGLLRNGTPLDFAKPTRDTRAQIINIVHDLLLRRDREQDIREQTALVLRNLRAEHIRKDAELDKLRSRVEEKERALLQTQIESRNLKLETKRLETNVKIIQDQLVRLKTSVGQIKTQCANDIRKRDVHIERLKSHLHGQQRGNKGGVNAPSLTVVGGGFGRGTNAFDASVRELQDPGYTLKQETNEFLTQLSQSLSDENDGLITMIHGTLQTLKILLGTAEANQDHCDSTRGSLKDDAEGDMTQAQDHSPMPYDVLEAELNSTMEVLKTVLTSPNFVSMDEVEVRDEEIGRLREGWEMMETRWKEVLLMMHGWRTRMEKTGDTLNLDDLRRGFDGFSLHDKPMSVQGGNTNHAEAGLQNGTVNDDASSEYSDEAAIPSQQRRTRKSSQEIRTTDNEHKYAINLPDFFDLKPTAEDRTLRGISPNVQSPRKVAFADETIPEAKASMFSPSQEVAGQLQTPTIVRGIRPESSPAQSRATSVQHNTRRSQRIFKRQEMAIAEDPAVQQDEPEDDASSPEPDFVEEEDVHPLTVQEKLHAAQTEAEEAAAHPSKDASQADMGGSQIDFELEEEINKLRSPAKKSRIKARPKRRKSTLSPEELGNLLGLE